MTMRDALRRILLTLVGVVAVSIVAAGGAALWLRLPEGPLGSLDPAIALEERDCGEGLPGARCGVVRVPLDHDDPEGEAIETGFALFPALVPWRGREEVVSIVGGGPGVPIVAMLREAPMWAFRLGLGGRPVLAIDPRGIGTSTRLECEAFAGPVPSGEPVGPRITACAEEIGPRRAHFSTANTARDFELVRRALGIDRLQLTAFSYGTNLAPVYARLHPKAMSSMVLDGAYPLTTYREFLPEYHQAVRRQFDLFCARSGACDGADAWAALGWAAAALREAPRPLDLPKGSAAARHGGAPMLDPSLLAALAAAIPTPPVDLDTPEVVRNEVLSGRAFVKPVVGGVLAARDEGDWGPLERAAIRHLAGWYPDASMRDPTLSREEHMARALSLAVDCPESNAPWDRAVPIPERLRQWTRAEEAEDAPGLAPFTVREWGRAPFTLNYYGHCVHWPPNPPDLPVERRHEVGRELPEPIPTLVINGDVDMNSPAEGAVLAQAEHPRAQLALLRHAGHAVIPTNLCAARLWFEFVRRGAVADPDRCRDAGPVDYHIEPPFDEGADEQ